jgi:two-component system, sensor histidine kinase and response regulator
VTPSDIPPEPSDFVPDMHPVALTQRLILIVDDLPENLQVLTGHLKAEGYEVIAANSGPRALALVRNKKPDLILLDVMMPGMDGYEVCRELKADAHSVDIPVIFITARAETDDILEGFKLGAVDYVTKPFKAAERISRHLRRLNDDKNRFLSIVSHDIRGAFGNVVSVSRLLTDAGNVDDNEAGQLLTDIGIEAEHMISLAENLLNIDAIERREIRLESQVVETRSLLEFAEQAHQLAARARNLQFAASCDGTSIQGDLTACRQILSNLVSNAVKYSPEGSTITLDIRSAADGFVQLSVRDQGSGISEEDQKKLFKPFTRLSSKTSSQEHSIGLGLSIVKLMAEGMGGRVRCESIVGQGTTFVVLLPAAS